MAATGLLSSATLRQVRDLANNSGLAARRRELFFTISDPIRDALTLTGRDVDAAAQLSHDLQRLNSFTEPVDGDCLLVIWLTNAAHALQLRTSLAQQFKAWQAEAAGGARVAIGRTPIGELTEKLRLHRHELDHLAYYANDLMFSKRLHDRLHLAQKSLTSFGAIVSSPIDPARWKPLARLQLSAFSGAADAMAGELVMLPADDDLARGGAAMVAALRQRIEALELSLDDVAADVLAPLTDFRAEVKKQMESLALRVEVDFKVLRLNDLIRLLIPLAESAKGSPEAAMWDEALRALTIINSDLSLLTPLHREWQIFDSLLWLAEDYFVHLQKDGAGQALFEDTWRRLARELKVLAGDPEAGWYANNVAAQDDFLTACPQPIAVPVNSQAPLKFGTFVENTRQIFYEIDVNIRASCDRLGPLTRQLAGL